METKHTYYTQFKFHTRERGSTVGAAWSGGVMLVLRELSDGEGGLAGVTEARGLVSFTLCWDGKLW